MGCAAWGDGNRLDRSIYPPSFGDVFRFERDSFGAE